MKIPKGGNQNPQIEEGQTTQWPKKEKWQNDKQRSTKHYTEKFRHMKLQFIVTCTSGIIYYSHGISSTVCAILLWRNIFGKFKLCLYLIWQILGGLEMAEQG